MSDMLGPEGLVLTDLVFGEYLPINIKSETPSSCALLAKRAEIANTAGREMEKVMAKLRVRPGL